MPSKSYFEDLLQGRRKSLFWGAFLYALSIVYRTAVYLRGLLFERNIISAGALPCPVVSIGNITLGGTGKTPTVIQVAGLLLQNKKRPVVISRGYGRKDDAEIVTVSDGHAILVDTETGGDEPVLIGSKLPGVAVVVGKNRYQAALVALRKFNSDVVILDDGFQHLRLKRNLDIVLLDSVNPFGNGKMFPAGILREPPDSLKRAHAVLIAKTDTRDVAALKETVRRLTKARIFTSQRVPVDLIDYRSNEIKPLSCLRGSKVLMLCGIARPESFKAMLRLLEADIVTECAYPDHFDYQKTDLATVYRKAADERIAMIVTTEKDAVRLKRLKAEGIWALRIELAVAEGKEWEAFLLEGMGNA